MKNLCTVHRQARLKNWTGADAHKKAFREIPGFGSQVISAGALSDKIPVSFTKKEGDYIIDLAGVKKQDYCTVISLDIKGKPVVYIEPSIQAVAPVFIDQLTVTIKTEIPGAVIHYTLDGT